MIIFSHFDVEKEKKKKIRALNFNIQSSDSDKFQLALLPTLYVSSTVFCSILHNSTSALALRGARLYFAASAPTLIRTMAYATKDFNGVSLLSRLPELPTSIPEANPKRNPLDAFRLAIAAQLVEIIPEITLQDAFPSVQVPVKGPDFTVPMPRFKIPGTKPNELAEKVVKEVSHPFWP